MKCQMKEERLLPNAELAEDGVEEVFGAGFADDFADGVDGDAEVEGREFQGEVLLEGFDGAFGGGFGALEGFLVTGVDHDLEHSGFDLAGPDEALDRVFEFFESF